MATPEVQSATPPRKRRWYQFSLRTLMIVMLLVSVGMSWFAVKLQQARRQRAAVSAIREAGGMVQYDYGNYLRAVPSLPTWLTETLGIDFLTKPNWVSLGPNGDDACLKKLTAMPSLERLDLPTTRVTDDGLAHLAQLPKLLWLDLTDNEITDDGLAHLAQLPQLKILYLSGNKMTDDGIAHLAKLSQLEELELVNLPITDTGLEDLKKLHQLRFLYLGGTKVTAQGVAELQKALPNCSIYGPQPIQPKSAP